jgi:hypothetical protein
MCHVGLYIMDKIPEILNTEFAVNTARKVPNNWHGIVLVSAAMINRLMSREVNRRLMKEVNEMCKCAMLAEF